jgi:hypothetical protein
MPQTYQPRKSIRVIAASSRDPGQHRVVNIKTAKRNEHAEYLQVSGDQGRTIPTVKDSGGQFAGLPTIVIQGYSAPN